MKKLFFLTIFIVLIQHMYPQGSTNAGPVDVPQILPGSPEASNLGKFGEIPVNLGIGVTNQTIPIYTIEEGGFELPISLNYNYTGLIVDEIPGITGLGWSLNAGGIITRQLRGRPDEEPNGYIGMNRIGVNWVLPYVNNELSTVDRNRLEENAASGFWDTQPDKFMISVGNIQATFYFDENKNVVVKPYKPYKIEVIGGDFNEGIKVTDDSGIQYLFKDKEITKRIPPLGINDILSTPVNGYISSWKLSKIVLPNNRSIDLFYNSYSHNQQTISQTFTKSVGPSGCGDNLRNAWTRYSVSSKIINRISFSLGEIEFNTSLPITTDLNAYLAVLQNIRIKDHFDKSILNYDFIYDDYSKTRKLLTSITVNNDNSNRYQFEYNGIPADNISFARQDFWGYANSNNTGKLVNINDLYGPRKPDFDSCSKGALQKIIYPTKGFTEFTYEQNTYDPGIDGDEYDDFYDANNSVCTYSNESHDSTSSATAGSDSDIVEFTISEDTSAEIIISIIKGTSGGGLGARIYRKNTEDNQQVTCQSSGLEECDSRNPCSIAELNYGSGFLEPGQVLNNSFTKKVYLKSGTYMMSTYVDNVGPEGESRASVRVNLNRGNIVPISSQIRSRQTGGIRIKTIKSCPDDDPANCISKEYLYETNDGISQGLLFRRRNLTSHEYNTSTLLSGSVQNCIYKSYSSSSNMPLGYYIGSHIIYKQVTEKTISGTVNNGAKTLTFSHNIPTAVSFPFAIKDDNAYKNGKLLKTELLKSDGTLVRQTTYQYDFDEDLNFDRRVYAIKVGQNGFNSQGPGSYTTDIVRFDASRNVDRLVQTAVTDYYDNSSVVTRSFNRYNNPYGHIKEKETINSNNEISITKFFYPYDFTTSITNELFNRNQIASPIDVITSQQVGSTEKILSKVHNIYKDWGNNVLLPEEVQTAKADGELEPRVKYTEYDGFGNPTEVAKTDGTPMAYIWGYNHQYPVAKIENMTYSGVSAYVNDIQSKSDLDTDHKMGGQGTEGALRTELNKLRTELPTDAMVTTYTYDPMVGVTSMTDPRGYTVYYEYDEFNRLQYVRDADGNLISENKYHYKN